MLRRKSVLSAAPRRHHIKRRTVIISGSIIIFLIIGGLFAWQLLHRQTEPKNSTETPQYQTILPEGKTIEALGGWTRVSPPEGDPVFAYTDKLNGVAINVSQQPLPANFLGNVNQQVADLAKSFHATTELNANGTKVYLGTSAQGPQFIIFTKKNLLIFIKSQQKIDDVAWTDYITSLR